MVFSGLNLFLNRTLFMWKACILVCLLVLVFQAAGQRTYRPSSILSAGGWFKIGVSEPGIYKIDFSSLNSMGFTTTGIPSSAIRLYGNGGQMLPENCSAPTTDDLLENAIEVVDGGDGIFNGSDYFLFYAPGPNAWLKDSINQRFTHRKNIYSDQSFYFITIGGAGKRIAALTNTSSPSRSITSFDERYFHELDSANFLSSGKEWYGEEFSNNTGHLTSRIFTIPLTNLVTTEPASIVSDCIARSIGNSSRFSLSINNVGILQQDINAVTSANTDLFAGGSRSSASFLPVPPLSVSYNYQALAPGAQGWLNWFELFARKKLSMNGVKQLLFRDWKSVGPGLKGEFVLQDADPETEVWDITEAGVPIKMKTVVSGSELKFLNDCAVLHEYIAFGTTSFLVPVPIGKVENQDLHALPAADLLIVSYPAIIAEANRLALYHQQQNKMKVSVVTASQVYNEFSSGSPDPTAIRDFVKMYYDRAGHDTAKSPRYLLLFGDASYDYKDRIKNNSNLVPAYLSALSLDPLTTFTSDDYFGFLDDNEDINDATLKNLLDIGIGRIPAKNVAEASSYVDKVVNYTATLSLGPWRNHLTFIADDEDYNMHFHDAEVIAETAQSTNPVFTQDKLYLDAFQQESNASGSRYPAVNQAIHDNIENGTLIWNYSGHGGFTRLAEEVVLDQDIVQSWNNLNKLPLFITATCDFAPYDNPAINSLGENILLRQKTGAIALMTTTRLVFAYSNRIMNRNYLLTALKQKTDGSYLSLGEAVKTAKNITFQSQSDIINNLKFTLLGDPALTLNYPTYNVQTTAVNSTPVTVIADTLKALQQYTISGSVTDRAGNILNDFGGNVYTTVYDKTQTETTRGNDPESIPENFQVQHNILFKGMSDVKNGRFSFRFIVPKDIGYQFGNGKISYYAENGKMDGNGSFTNFIIGGSQGTSPDKTGPDIRPFLDDEKFVNSGHTGPEPLLIVKLTDSSGINVSGLGIGHDLVAMLDKDPKKLFVLNDYYQADLNSYQKGTINFPLPILEEGIHTLMVKAWDAANNSNEISIEFRVVKKPVLTVFHVFTFPNPFSSKTTFRIEHDLETQTIQVFIRIFTLSGMLVKSVHQTINTGGNRSCDIQWDGKNDNGAGLTRGIYTYTLWVETVDGLKARQAGKIVKL